MWLSWSADRRKHLMEKKPTPCPNGRRLNPCPKCAPGREADRPVECRARATARAACSVPWKARRVIEEPRFARAQSPPSIPHLHPAQTYSCPFPKRVSRQTVIVIIIIATVTTAKTRRTLTICRALFRALGMLIWVTITAPTSFAQEETGNRDVNESAQGRPTCGSI